MTTLPRWITLITLLLRVANLRAQPQPGTLLWTVDIGRTIMASPAIAPDGTLYLSSDTAMYAITNNGSSASNAWSFPVSLPGSPAVGLDGTVYVNSEGSLIAVNPDGSRKWTFSSDSGSLSVPPAIGLDNTLYFLAGGSLYAILPVGTKKWEISLDVTGMGYQAPVIGTDGTICVGLQRTLYAFNPDGTIKWSGTYYGNGTESPAIGSDGTVYFSARQLYAFTPKGTNLWAVDQPIFDGSPVVGKSGTIYASAWASHTLYAITPDGQVAWHALFGSDTRTISTAATVDDAGTIYYCASNQISALNPQGQVQWTIQGRPPAIGTEGANTSPVIGADGTLYAALDTTLYAIAGTNPPPSSGWPMYRQNARHTGKVEKPALKQPKKRADANFEFQLYAQLGQTNVIESTTNLNTWTSLTSIVVTTVPQPVVDLTASNAPTRHYRTIAP